MFSKELHKELKVLKPAFRTNFFYKVYFDLVNTKWVLAGSYRYFATRECENAQVRANPG